MVCVFLLILPSKHQQIILIMVSLREKTRFITYSLTLAHIKQNLTKYTFFSNSEKTTRLMKNGSESFSSPMAILHQGRRKEVLPFSIREGERKVSRSLPAASSHQRRKKISHHDLSRYLSWPRDAVYGRDVQCNTKQWMNYILNYIIVSWSRAIMWLKFVSPFCQVAKMHSFILHSRIGFKLKEKDKHCIVRELYFPIAKCKFKPSQITARL